MKHPLNDVMKGFIPMCFSIALAGLLAAMLLCVPGSNAYAERADQNKPLNVSADSWNYDDLKQIHIFTGHVILTKGTILIKADKVVARQDPQGYHFFTATVASNRGNQLAYFRQKRDVGNEYIQGYAQQIDYNDKNGITVLKGRAQVQRLQGLTQIIDQIHGDTIRYDSRNDLYSASSGKAGISPQNPDGRVRIMLMPQNAASASLQSSKTPVPLTLAPNVNGVAQ
jgi:lipopolysaccharide export system protein LptA